MSEAAAHHIDATGESANPPQGWLTTASAAAAMGCDARTVRRHCDAGRLTGGMFAGAWYVDPTSHPALRMAVGDTSCGPVLLGSELAGLTAAQRQRAFERQDVVKHFEAALANKPATTSISEFVERWMETWNSAAAAARRVKRTQLYAWRKAYAKKGIAGLVDRRGGKRKPIDFSHEAKEFIAGAYARQTTPSLPYIYQLAQSVAAEQGWKLPSLRTVQRWLRNKIDPKIITAGREPKTFRDRCVPHIRRDWTKVPAQVCWIADHRIFDVLLPRRHNGEVTWQRPWVTMFMDARSWYPVGWIIDFDSPNADRIMSAFIQAVEIHGAPQHLILDNGKDFRAYELAGSPSRRRREKLFDQRRTQPLLEALGVTPHWAQPYNAKAKTVERFFGVMAAQFDRAWPTYCGHTPTARPEHLKGLKPDQVDPQINIDTFREAFAGWVEADYACSPSPAAAAAGMSPWRAFNELRTPGYQAVTPAPETLSLLLTRGRRVRVDANGVYVAAFGRYYWADELEERRCASGNDVARHVCYRYKIGDPSKVWIFDFKSDRFLAIAVPKSGQDLHPLAESDADREAVTDAIRTHRHIAKATNAEAKRLRLMANNVLLQAHRSGARAAGILDDPQTVKVAPQPMVRISGELDRAAIAAAAHEDEQRRSGNSPKQAMEAFFAATGTDNMDRPTTADTDADDEAMQGYVDPLSQLTTQRLEAGDVCHARPRPAGVSPGGCAGEGAD